MQTGALSLIHHESQRTVLAPSAVQRKLLKERRSQEGETAQGGLTGLTRVKIQPGAAGIHALN